MGRWGVEIVRYKYKYKYGIGRDYIIMFHVKHINSIRGQKQREAQSNMRYITYITLSYYVNILTYTYNFNKYIYEKISLSLILFIMCNVLRNFMQSLAHKDVYNDLL